MTSRKTLRMAMIDKAGKKWNTKPERQFDAYQFRRQLGLMQNVTLPFVAPNREGVLTRYDFQLDFARPTDVEVYQATGYHDPNATYDIDYEIDGAGHNGKNDLWKDNLKNKHGLKVIHIGAPLCAKEWWCYLDTMIPKALLSPSPTVYIWA